MRTLLVAAASLSLVAGSQAQTPVADTTRPALPSALNLPSDSTITVRWPGSEALYFRSIVGIEFDDTTAGTTIRAVLRKHDGVIIGGSPATGPAGAYIVRVPDPGPTFEAFQSILSRIRSEPGVARAFGVTYRGIIVIHLYSPPYRRWPLLTNKLPDLDTSRVVPLEGDTSFLIFRTDISLRFKPEVSDSAKAAFLARHSVTVIGVTETERFFVRMPDPGPSIQSFYDALDRIEREPEVFLVSLIPRTPLPAADFARSPAHGRGHAPDTSRPPMPAELNLPDDSTLTVPSPDSLAVYYRNIVGIIFDDTASGTTIRRVLHAFQAQIIGGAPDMGESGAYIVRVPDPGPSFHELDAVLDRIAAEHGVNRAFSITYRDHWDPKVR